MTTYLELLKKYKFVEALNQSRGDRLQFLSEMYAFQEFFNNARKTLTTDEARDLDIRFHNLFTKVETEYLLFQDKKNQETIESGESPPTKDQVGECTENITFFSEQYPGFRSIRGDGNCYYRAIMVGLIEQIILSADRGQLFQALANKFTAIQGAYEGRYDNKLCEFIRALNKASLEKKWKTVEDFEQELRNPTSRLDSQIIQSVRVLYAERITNWMPKEFIINEDISNILTLGKEADGAGIEIGVLPEELGIECDLFRFNQHGVVKTKPESWNKFGGDVSRFKVCLLYKENPGHYDLLYTPEQYFQIKFPDGFQPLIKDYLESIKLNTSSLENSQKNLMNYIRFCPECDKASIKVLLNDGFLRLKEIGQAFNYKESFFILLRQNSQQMYSLLRGSADIYPSSMFRQDNYKVIMDAFVHDPIANKERFKTIFDYLKTMDIHQIELSMEDIRKKITTMQTNADRKVKLLLISSMANLDIQVQKLIHPEKMVAFTACLSEYVNQLETNPETARLALLENIIMFPSDVQNSLYAMVHHVLEPLKKQSPNLRTIICDEFDELRAFANFNYSNKMP